MFILYVLFDPLFYCYRMFEVVLLIQLSTCSIIFVEIQVSSTLYCVGPT